MRTNINGLEKSVNGFHSNLNGNSALINLEDYLRRSGHRGSGQESTIDRLFKSKRKNLKANATALLEELENRKKINRSIMDKIDNEIFNFNVEIDHLINSRLPYDFSTQHKKKESISDLESKVQSLEQEKRRELVECWKDLMLLKKDLMFALKEYWDVVKRHEVLES